MLHIDIDRKRIHRFGEKNAQGVAYAHDNIWYFASEKRVLKYVLGGSLWQTTSRPKRILTADLKDFAQAATREGRHLLQRSTSVDGPPTHLPQAPEEFDHIGDISYHKELLFVPVRAKNSDHDAILVLDEALRLVGFSYLFSYLGRTSNAWCAVNQKNGLLYMGDRNEQHVLRAFDVSSFYKLFEEGAPADWPQWHRLIHKPESDIVLKKEDGSPEAIHSIQGVCFTPEGKLWVARYYTTKYLIAATEWHNFLRLYDTGTGKILQTTEEINFTGVGDEIEGITMAPDGTLCVVVAVNALDGDKFDIYAFAVNSSVPLMGGTGGTTDHDRSTVKHVK